MAITRLLFQGYYSGGISEEAREPWRRTRFQTSAGSFPHQGREQALALKIGAQDKRRPGPGGAIDGNIHPNLHWAGAEDLPQGREVRDS